MENPDAPVENNIDKINIVEDAIKFLRIPEGKYSPFRIMRNYEQERMKSLYVHVGRDVLENVFIVFITEKNTEFVELHLF